MSATHEPLVTIVTPVYNGAEFLEQCIRSVLAQTYRNWEYVIVDNCSTDETPAIIARFARDEPRIRTYRNETLVSAMANHHVGFTKMSPESRYCKVVHADDWIFPECVAKMVAVAEAHPTVGVVGSYRLEEDVVTLDGLPFPDTWFSGREICRRTLLGEFYVFGTPTSLLLRSDLIRARMPVYDEERYPNHFDTAACYELLRRTDFGFVHQVLTYTRRDGAVRTSAAERIGSSCPEHLMMLQQYGPIYLERRELETLLEEKTRKYYRLLGVRAFRRPGPVFWRHHRAALQRLGLPHGRHRLFFAFLAAAFAELKRPLEDLRALRLAPPQELTGQSSR